MVKCRIGIEGSGDAHVRNAGDGVGWSGVGGEVEGNDGDDVEGCAVWRLVPACLASKDCVMVDEVGWKVEVVPVMEQDLWKGQVVDQLVLGAVEAEVVGGEQVELWIECPGRC